jgi:hypothetical protein
MSEKDSVPSKLWEVVTTLTDSAQQAGVRKARESGFDLDAGQIPFEETLLNLSHNREVLLDAINKGRIVQLPLKLQYRLLAEATKVKLQLESLIAGADVAVPLESAVEDLNTTVWQLNLQNLSEQVLGFDAKMNELKAQETQIKKVLRDADRVAELLSSLQMKEEQAQEITGKISSAQVATAEDESNVSKILETATEIEQKIVGVSSVVQAHETSIAQSSAASKEFTASIELAHADVLTHLGEIDNTKEAYQALETQIKELLETTESSAASIIEQLKSEASETKADLTEQVCTLVASTKKSLEEQVETDVAEMMKAVSQIEDATTKFSASMADAEAARNQNAEEQLEKSSNEFVLSLESEKARYKEIFNDLEQQSKSTISKNDAEAERLTTYLAELESRIHKSIERATGFTLFHAFQSRQAGLRRSTNWWAGALGVCVGASVLLSWLLIHSITSAPQYSPLFFMKLAISLPIIFAITFCSVQYSRERRLEEEYAFKSSISISLEPYRKLVGELINKNDPAEVAKYTDFLIASINRVFTSPTAQVFDGDEVDGRTAGGLLKTAGSVAESLIKAKLK